ncbi:hypothetical protein GOP47_0026204 [Adiantum capillus-veneris]|nr:hypothetical protein GOP47_0026204 [Adiantum capillus-veneris]
MGFYTLLFSTTVALLVTSYVIYVYYWRPSCIRKALLNQGFIVLPYHPIAGDLPQLQHLEAQAQIYDISSPSDHHLLVPYVLPFYNMLICQHPGSRVVYWRGNLPIIVISKANDARSILSADVNYMQKISYSTRAFHRLLGDGLLLANGKDWRLQRDILRPAFFVEKLKGLLTDMATSSLDMIQAWKVHADTEEHMKYVEIEVAGDLKNLAADILSCTMFGSSYLKGKSVFKRQELLLKMVLKLRAQITANPFYEFLPTNLNREVRALDRKNNQELREIIEQKKHSVEANSLESKAVCSYGTDLLGLVLDAVEEGSKLGREAAHLSMQKVIDECKTFFFAGHETTANLLAWTLVLLSLHQEWQERARQEVWEICGKHGELNADNLNKLKIVGMILNESLRLYPPVPEYGTRELFQDVRMGDGTVLPRGAGITIACLYIHRDKEVWGEDADEFRPDRFANGVSQACNNPYAFMPFGIGPRTCIGQHFALMEAKIILSLILQSFQFHLSPSYRHAPITAITMRPKYGVHLLLRSLSN